MAIKVKLLSKQIKGGKETLYLDFYPAIEQPKTGKTTRREFLKRYVYIDKHDLKRKIELYKAKGKNTDKLTELYDSLKHLTPIQKRHNAETWATAQSIRQQRDNQLNKPEIYSKHEQEQLKLKELGEKCFVEYFKTLANKRKASNHDNWVSALRYLERFTGGKLKFADLDVKFLEDFKEFLLTTPSNKSNKSTLAQNSAHSYFNKVKAALKEATMEGFIQDNINAKVKRIKYLEVFKEDLTIDELNALIRTPCTNDLLKRAALFSALTGLRHKNIINMKWGELEYVDFNDGWYVFKHRGAKSKRIEFLPIPKQGYGLTLGKPDPKEMPKNELVFQGLKYSAHVNKHLAQWIESAGISKKITFHCFRHSYATIQSNLGTDLHVLSKMLGHKNVKTTQVYAKIKDDTKIQASNMIKLALDEYAN